MTASATITTDSRPGVLTVPAAAIQFARDQGPRLAKRTAPAPDNGKGDGATQASVLVLAGGEPVLQPIRVGLSDGTTTEVVAGLDEGQSVITAVASS